MGPGVYHACPGIVSAHTIMVLYRLGVDGLDLGHNRYRYLTELVLQQLQQRITLALENAALFVDCQHLSDSLPIFLIYEALKLGLFHFVQPQICFNNVEEQ